MYHILQNGFATDVSSGARQAENLEYLNSILENLNITRIFFTLNSRTV